MRAILVFAFASAILCHDLKAQKTRYFNAGPGGAYSVHNDAGLSPLPYEGLQFAGLFSIEKSSGRNWNEFSLRMQGGFVSPVEKGGSATRGFIGLSYQHLYQTAWGKDKFNINVGPSISAFADNVIHDQYANNVIHPIWDVTVGLAGRASRNFYLFKRRFDAAFVLDLPLWGLGMRPDYAYSAPKGYYMHPNDFWKAARDSYFYVYPPKLIRVKTKVELTYFLKNKNAIGLVYNWDYSKLHPLDTDAVNAFEAASHGLYFITKFRF
jgi:hypothetical protein